VSLPSCVLSAFFRRGSDPLRRVLLYSQATASDETYPLSLHDALPICSCSCRRPRPPRPRFPSAPARATTASRCGGSATTTRCTRSEEHTSELQSRENLVCRLLLEKKKYARRSDHEAHHDGEVPQRTAT